MIRLAEGKEGPKETRLEYHGPDRHVYVRTPYITPYVCTVLHVVREEILLALMQAFTFIIFAFAHGMASVQNVLVLSGWPPTTDHS